MAWSSPSLPPASPRRCAPNLPGSLTRSLSKRLGVRGFTARRVALLYGDMEWRAGGKPSVRYCIRDYARRQGVCRNTTRDDLRRLLSLGAISLLETGDYGGTYWLHGLGWPEGADESGTDDDLRVGVGQNVTPQVQETPPTPGHPLTHPGSDDDPPLGHGTTHLRVMGRPPLEKGFKTQEKTREEKGSNPQPPSPPLPEQVSGNPETLASDAPEIPQGLPPFLLQISHQRKPLFPPQGPLLPRNLQKSQRCLLPKPAPSQPPYSPVSWPPSRPPSPLSGPAQVPSP